ncbi:MAG: hypothetical protein G5Z42_07010 [Caldisphaeraceae archaeon]|nr:hypothetical protein [Caldisphaeraceae archaeon]MEB3798546.1 hypothetical protein [Caldisphaeraceae archaeon]
MSAPRQTLGETKENYDELKLWKPKKAVGEKGSYEIIRLSYSSFIYVF